METDVPSCQKWKQIAIHGSNNWDVDHWYYYIQSQHHYPGLIINSTANFYQHNTYIGTQFNKSINHFYYKHQSHGFKASFNRILIAIIQLYVPVQYINHFIDIECKLILLFQGANFHLFELTDPNHSISSAETAESGL